MTAKVNVINGPNLGRLGKREQGCKGSGSKGFGGADGPDGHASLLMRMAL